MHFTRKLDRIVLFILEMLIFSCAWSALNAQVTEEQFNRKAYEHFSNGLLLKMQGKHQEALDELIQASNLDTNNAVILKTIGDLLIFDLGRESGNIARGVAVYEKYLEYNPTDERTMDIVLQIYLRASRPPRLDRAESVLKMVISRGNDIALYAVTLTDILLQQKKTEEGQSTAIQFIKRSGESQEACFEVAEIFTNNSMVVEGIDYFSNYLKQHPTVINIGITVGRLYEVRDDAASAESAYLEVLKKNETSYVARLNLALLYVRKNNIDKALQLYQGIAYDDPQEIEVKSNICEKLLQDEKPPFDKIEIIMNTVKNKVGADEKVFYYLGRAYAGQNKFPEAVESYKTALEHDPDNVLVQYYLANTHYELKNYPESITAISRAIELVPEEKAFYVVKGLVYDKMGDFKNASDTYEKGLAIQVSPQNQSAHATLLNNYSYLLSQQEKDLDRALQMVQDALKTEPDNSSYTDTFGWVLFKMGKYDEALTYIKKAVEADSKNAEILDHMGDVYMKLGNKDKAKEYWQKALEIDKTNQQIQEKIRKIK
jgi:tetratricopeptide (TPR) repeat protein